MPARIRALGELRGPREAALFAYVSAFAATVPLLMRLPLPRAARLLVRTPAARRDSVSPERIAALVSIAHRALHPVVRDGCLTRGVTLFWFLRRSGVDVELRFGLDPSGAEADGHCWLALSGEPYLEKVDPRPRFAETYRLPLAA
jgi:hypothetical protein